MNKSFDAKHDKVLKGLLRLPDNRRCAVCDTLGPQYVVVNFSIFVCTICCGIHRQFNHRCKGISMASFKPEEIRALEDGGNGVALATYLAKWNPRDAPKPVDRNIGKVRDWIDLVFVKKRFFSAEASSAAALPPVSRTQSVSSARSTTSRENDFALKTAPEGYSNGNSAFQAVAHEQRGGKSDAGSLIDLELSPRVPAGPAPSGFPEGFDADFQSAPSTSAAPTPAAPAPAPQAGQPSGWAAFEDPQPHAAPAAASSTPQIQSAAASTQEQPKAEAFSGWQAFDSQPAQPQQPPSAPAAASGSQARLMKELPSDLFSELAAPAPQQQQPQGYGQTRQQVGYGQMGQLYGQQMGGPGAGFLGAPASVFPYPYAQPVPPGYQPFMLANPAAGAPQQPQLRSFPPPAAEPPQEPARSDVFSGLVPGLKSSLPAVPSAPASGNSPPQASYSNGGMQQSQAQSQYGQFGQPFGGFPVSPGPQRNGEDHWLQAAQQPYTSSFAGPQASPMQPKKGGNPFA